MTKSIIRRHFMILANRIKDLIYIDYKLNQDLRDYGSCYIGKQNTNELHKALKILNDNNRFRFIMGYNTDDSEILHTNASMRRRLLVCRQKR